MTNPTNRDQFPNPELSKSTGLPSLVLAPRVTGRVRADGEKSKLLYKGTKSERERVREWKRT